MPAKNSNLLNGFGGSNLVIGLIISLNLSAFLIWKSIIGLPGLIIFNIVALTFYLIAKLFPNMSFNDSLNFFLILPPLIAVIKFINFFSQYDPKDNHYDREYYFYSVLPASIIFAFSMLILLTIFLLYWRFQKEEKIN